MRTNELYAQRLEKISNSKNNVKDSFCALGNVCMCFECTPFKAHTIPMSGKHRAQRTTKPFFVYGELANSETTNEADALPSLKAPKQ